jgi:dienelactone hydrolase
MTGLAKTTSNACVALSNASLNALARNDYKSAGKDFAPAFASQSPPSKVEQAWQSLQAAVGDYQSHGVARVQTVRGQAVVVTPIKFAHASWDALFTCDSHSQITTAQLLPASQLDDAIDAVRRAAAVKSQVKPRTEANGVRVEPLSVPSPYGPLRGALTLPASGGSFPAVVLVGGSGPNDLDESVGGSKPFQDIADGLAAAGIASLRYDKRQTDYPAKMSTNAHLTVDEEETDDALTAAHLLANQQGVDKHRIFVLGHSEGGMLAPRIGQRDPGLAGIIMLAAPARKLLAVIREQVRDQGQRLGIPVNQIQASEKQLVAEEQLLDSASPKLPPQGSFSGAPQSWWLSLHDYNQVAVAKSLRLPILILQGGSDFQVSPKRDFDAWKKALAGKPNVTFHLYPGLSHLFTPAGKTLTTADYKKPAKVDPNVILDMVSWITAQAASHHRQSHAMVTSALPLRSKEQGLDVM